MIAGILGGASPAFLLRVNAKLDIEVDSYMQEKINANPMVQPFLMDSNTLVMMTSKNPVDAQFDNYLETSLPPPVGMAIKFLLEFLGDEIEVDFAHPQLGVHARLHGEGLGLIVRTGAKYIPV